MSGGSMDYLYARVLNADFVENTPERRALRGLLNRLGKALKAVEWNDSGDGANGEAELILDCLRPGDLERQLLNDIEGQVQRAEAAVKRLRAGLEGLTVTVR